MSRKISRTHLCGYSQRCEDLRAVTFKQRLPYLCRDKIFVEFMQTVCEKTEDRVFLRKEEQPRPIR